MEKIKQSKIQSLESILEGLIDELIPKESKESRFPEKKPLYSSQNLEILSKYLIEEKKNKEYYTINENIIIKQNKEINYSNIIKEYISYNTILSPKLGTVKTSPYYGLNIQLEEDVSINADNLGEFALPIVEYIRQTRPDFVVASDRGARLLGLAVFKLYRELYGRLPTADGTLRFRRFSKSNSEEETESHLAPLVEEMFEHSDNPYVLVLDDWVCSGRTQRLAKETFKKLGHGKIEVRFGVLVGHGADVSGHGGKTSNFASTTDWHDDSNTIGITYGDTNGGHGIRGRPVRSTRAFDYRKRMYKGITKLANRIKTGNEK